MKILVILTTMLVTACNLTISTKIVRDDMGNCWDVSSQPRNLGKC